jgi:uncharacterized protein YecA (UPF0149 family)
MFRDSDGDDDTARLIEAKTVSRKKSHSRKYRDDDEKVGRNDKCPCGSGRRFKKCCM